VDPRARAHATTVLWGHAALENARSRVCRMSVGLLAPALRVASLNDVRVCDPSTLGQSGIRSHCALSSLVCSDSVGTVATHLTSDEFLAGSLYACAVRVYLYAERVGQSTALAVSVPQSPNCCENACGLRSGGGESVRCHARSGQVGACECARVRNSSKGSKRLAKCKLRSTFSYFQPAVRRLHGIRAAVFLTLVAR
jgi:hypothetical protein